MIAGLPVAAVVLIAVVMVVASCLQASIGFGMGMLGAPVIGLIDPSVLPGLIILLAVVVSLTVAVKERAALDLHGAGWALVGRIPGSVLGAWLVALLPATGMAWLVAVVVLGGVAMAFLGWRPEPRRVSLITAGAASGVFGTATSIGGAPMALVWQASSGPRLRGTMSAFFLVGSVISVGMLALFGALTLHTVVFAAWMLPAVALGYLLSRVVNRYLDKGRLRAAALWASAIGAALLIATLVL